MLGVAVVDRPVALKPDPSGIPAELKDRAQWVLWRYLPPDPGKDHWRKVPWGVAGPASSANAATWMSYDHAWELLETGDYDGIGYVFSAEDPYIGIDFDHSFDLDQWRCTTEANDWLLKLNSYTELSASGTGVHCLIKAQFPFERGRKTSFVEVYKQKRFFTMTGCVFEGLPAVPQEAQVAFDALVAAFFTPQTKPDTRVPASLSSFDDRQIVERCQHAKNGQKFLSLWEGRWQGLGYPSQSEAEFALLGILRFWTQDKSQLSRLMRSSSLARGKWDSKRGEGTYGDISIANSLSGLGEHYDANYTSGPRLVRISNSNGHEQLAPGDPSEEEQEEESETVKPYRYTVHHAAEAFEAIPPVAWVIGDLLSKGSVAAIVGAPGSKKTYTALDMAVAVALGTEWLGRTVIQGPVLIVDEESGNNRLRRRLREVLRGHEADALTPIHWVTLEGVNMLSANEIEQLDALVAEIQPVLVLVDALADVMPGADENAVGETHPVLMAFRQLADRHQCCVTVIHHSNKAGSYRGSTAILGAIDLMLMVDSPKETNEIRYFTEKARDTDPQMFAALITFDPLKGTVRLTPAMLVQTDKRRPSSEQYVIDYLRAHKGCASVTDIQSHADCCSPEGARRAIYRLAEEGIVQRADSGKTGEKAIYRLVEDQLSTPVQPVLDLC